jgi:hypothetical protein
MQLALVENALERYSYAAEYAEVAVAKRPDSVQARLMLLHFLYATGKLEQATSMFAELQQLRASGKLSAEESDTLSLYEE